MTEPDNNELTEVHAEVGEDPDLAIQEKLRELRQGLFSTRSLKPAELKTAAQDLLDLATHIGEVPE